jgi:hypothetical protein
MMVPAHPDLSVRTALMLERQWDGAAATQRGVGTGREWFVAG